MMLGRTGPASASLYLRPCKQPSLFPQSYFNLYKRPISSSKPALFAKKGPDPEALKKMMDMRKAAKTKEKQLLGENVEVDEESRSTQPKFKPTMEADASSGTKATKLTDSDRPPWKRLQAYFMNMGLLIERRKEIKKVNAGKLVADSVKEKIYLLHKLDPKVYNVPELALRFGYQQGRILAWLKLKEAEKVEIRNGTILPPDLLQLIETYLELPERRDDRVRLAKKHPAKPVTYDLLDDGIDEYLYAQKLKASQKKIKPKILPKTPPPYFEFYHPQEPIESNLPKAYKKTFIVDSSRYGKMLNDEQLRMIHVREGTILRNATWEERRKILMEYFTRDRNEVPSHFTNPEYAEEVIGTGRWDWDSFPKEQHPEEKEELLRQQANYVWQDLIKTMGENDKELQQNLYLEMYELGSMIDSWTPANEPEAFVRRMADSRNPGQINPLLVSEADVFDLKEKGAPIPPRQEQALRDALTSMLKIPTDQMEELAKHLVDGPEEEETAEAEESPNDIEGDDELIDDTDEHIRPDDDEDEEEGEGEDSAFGEDSINNSTSALLDILRDNPEVQ